MKNTKGGKNTNLVRKNKMLNNMKNNLSLKIEDVPLGVDVAYCSFNRWINRFS